MPDTRRRDVVVLVTSPPLGDPRTASPFDAPSPEDVVFCCFFRDAIDRREALDDIKRVAGSRDPLPSDPDDATEELAGVFRAAQHAGDARAALRAAIRWRVGVLKGGYHTYSLRVGFAPYASSCVISFDEHDADSIRLNVAEALRAMEEDKARVLDAFGLGGFWGPDADS